MDFQYCPKCEAFNPPGVTHCTQCKAELPEETPEFAPAASTEEPPSSVPEPAATPDVDEQASEPAAPEPEPRPFDAPPEILARIERIEAEIAKKPEANALYLQLSQVYLDAGRKDLAAEPIERCLEREPKNVYLRHRLAQITGVPASGPATTAVKADVVPPTAAPVQSTGPKPATARVAVPRRPAYRAPVRRRPAVSRWAVLGGLAAVLLLGTVIKVFFFPGPKLLVTGAFSAISPKWSPTGRQFAFLLQDREGSQLAVYDLKTASHHVLARLGFGDARSFSWSPDGSRIAYAGPTTQGWGREVSVVDVQSGSSRRVAPGSSPLWTPDGRTLLMWCAPSSDTDGEFASEVDEFGPCRVDAQSGAIQQRATGAEDARPEWGAEVSPVLGQIAYDVVVGSNEAEVRSASGNGEFVDMVDSAAARGARNFAEGSRDLSRELQARQYDRRRRGGDAAGASRDIYVASFEGGPARRLTTDGISGSPTWTADGSQILFESGRKLHLMNSDGSGRRALLGGNLELADPPAAQLTRDGRYVVFTAPVAANAGLAKLMTGETPADLYLARVGDSSARRLANRHSFKQRFALSPDGRRIVYEVLAETGTLTNNQTRSELWIMWR